MVLVTSAAFATVSNGSRVGAELPDPGMIAVDSHLSSLGASVWTAPTGLGDSLLIRVLDAAATPEAKSGSGQQQDQENDDDDCEHVTS